MMQIQDIVLRNVRDPIAKRNIARELIALAQGHSPLSAVSEPIGDTIETETAIEIKLKEG
jgi:hypothetical protein